MSSSSQLYPVHWSTGLESEALSWRQVDSMFMSFDPYNPQQQQRGVNGTIFPGIGPTERLNIILSHQNMLIKATDLTLFLEKCPPEALKENYQTIIDRIFTNNDQGSVSWELRSCKKVDRPQETAAILKLLAPDGPLITLALRLMDDHNFMLEYPLSGIPYHLRNKLMEGDIPPYFVNKVTIIQSPATGQNIVQQLLLNPFEYFVFSFAGVNLLGQSSGRAGPDYLSGWAALQDTLFTSILNEFLMYYFPCNGQGVPPHTFNYVSEQSKDAVFMTNSLLRQQQSKPKFTVNSHEYLQHQQETDLPKLFKSSVLQEQSGNTSGRENLFLATHPSAYKEIWRSETILHIFMEMWINGYQEALDKKEYLSSSNPTAFGGLPSVDIVKSVRMMVRQLHYFVNCVNTHAMHPMEEIKRTSVPVFQRKLYAFLRYLFHHWPLDNSFRIVYETWLSYIQPWRYVNMERNVQSQGRESADVPVDRRWFNFILENILFYTKFFTETMIRLERIDLTATKNALMFYRLAKVFTTHETLKLMIQEIELSIHAYERQAAATAAALSSANHANEPAQNGFKSSPRSVRYSTPLQWGRVKGSKTVGGYFGGGGGRLSPILGTPSTSPSTTNTLDFNSTANLARMAHLKQLMKDWENPKYVYEPMIYPDNSRRMGSLLRAALEARDSLDDSANKMDENKSKSWILYFYSFFQDIFEETPTNTPASVQNAIMEKKRAANQLDYARNQFAVFFDLPINEERRFGNNTTNPSHAMSYGSLIYSPESSAYASFVNGSKQRKACLPAGVIVEEDLIPQGNPDLAMIRSDEFRPLVQALRTISRFFNHVFEDHINQIYFQPTWSGRYLRAMLAEPTEYIISEKLGRPGMNRKTMRHRRYLEPRVNLRPLGSYYASMWLFVMIVAANMMNWGVGMSVFAFLTLYFIYLSFRATSEPVNKLEELRQQKNNTD